MTLRRRKPATRSGAAVAFCFASAPRAALNDTMINRKTAPRSHGQLWYQTPRKPVTDFPCPPEGGALWKTLLSHA
jgi:hypothetical protein